MVLLDQVVQAMAITCTPGPVAAIEPARDASGRNR
jgi:hypothetical protein